MNKKEIILFVSPTEDKLIAMANAILDRNEYSPIKRDDEEILINTMFISNALNCCLWQNREGNEV